MPKQLSISMLLGLQTVRQKERSITQYEKKVEEAFLKKGEMMNYIQSLRSILGTRPIIAPGSAIIVENNKNEILLQLRSDTYDWGIPGGGMELGDSFEETAIKELYEETGLIANHLEILGVASGKEFYYKFPNEDEIYNATVIFKALDVTGKMIKDEESLELAYFPLDSLPHLNYTTQKILEKIGYLKEKELKKSRNL